MSAGTLPPEMASLTKVGTRLDHEGQVLRLELTSPPGNVLDTEMIRDIRKAVTAASGMNSLKLLVFSGAGKHFSFGASVEEHRPEKVEAMFAEFHGLFRDLLRHDVPLVALVQGQCLGGGLELAAFCDWVFAREGAKLGQPEIKLGVFAPMGSLLIPWRCSGHAADLLLAGRTVDAVEALTLGLVDHLLPEQEWEEVLDRWIRDEILGLSASSLRLARRASRLAFNRRIRDGLEEVEALYLRDLMQTHDAVEGIKAFLEKRNPEWTDD